MALDRSRTHIQRRRRGWLSRQLPGWLSVVEPQSDVRDGVPQSDGSRTRLDHARLTAGSVAQLVEQLQQYLGAPWFVLAQVAGSSPVQGHLWGYNNDQTQSKTGDPSMSYMRHSGRGTALASSPQSWCLLLSLVQCQIGSTQIILVRYRQKGTGQRSYQYASQTRDAGTPRSLCPVRQTVQTRCAPRGLRHARGNRMALPIVPQQAACYREGGLAPARAIWEGAAA